jgi:hypothetical protein
MAATSQDQFNQQYDYKGSGNVMHGAENHIGTKMVILKVTSSLMACQSSHLRPLQAVPTHNTPPRGM